MKPIKEAMKNYTNDFNIEYGIADFADWALIKGYDWPAIQDHILTILWEHRYKKQIKNKN